MKAVVAVIGQDRVGILAKISNACAESNASVDDVSQTVMQNFFTMVMLVDISALNCSFRELTERLTDTGRDVGMKVHVMHEDIFNSMHRI